MGFKKYFQVRGLEQAHSKPQSSLSSSFAAWASRFLIFYNPRPCLVPRA
jgi:hypothetical protein